MESFKDDDNRQEEPPKSGYQAMFEAMHDLHANDQPQQVNAPAPIPRAPAYRNWHDQAPQPQQRPRPQPQLRQRPAEDYQNSEVMPANAGRTARTVATRRQPSRPRSIEQGSVYMTRDAKRENILRRMGLKKTVALGAGILVLGGTLYAKADDWAEDGCRSLGPCSAVFNITPAESSAQGEITSPPEQILSSASFPTTEGSKVSGIASYNIELGSVKEENVTIKQGKKTRTDTIIGIGISADIDYDKTVAINPDYANKPVNLIGYLSGMVSGSEDLKEACRSDMEAIINEAQEHAYAVAQNSDLGFAKTRLSNSENGYMLEPYSGVKSNADIVDAYVYFDWMPDKDDPYYETNTKASMAHAKIVPPGTKDAETYWVQCTGN